jgi:hypothetical protein
MDGHLQQQYVENEDAPGLLGGEQSPGQSAQRTHVTPTSHIACILFYCFDLNLKPPLLQKKINYKI